MAITKVSKFLSFCVRLLCEIHLDAQAVVVDGEEIHPRRHTGLYSQLKWL